MSLSRHRDNGGALVIDETGLVVEINFQTVEVVQAGGPRPLEVHARGSPGSTSHGADAGGCLSSRAGGSSVFHCPVQ